MSYWLAVLCSVLEYRLRIVFSELLRKIIHSAYKRVVLTYCFQYATLAYMSLYDALFLYGLALRDAFEEIGGYDVHQNGSFIWSKMTNRQFIGWSMKLFLDMNVGGFYRRVTIERWDKDCIDKQL